MKKMLYLNALMILCISFSTPVFAQNFTETPEFLKANSHWAFGYHAGLNFSAGSPVSITTDIAAWEGPSTVSDPVTGELLFYTNGEDVRNALGDIMPNGDSLLGNSNYSAINFDWHLEYISTNQGTCIVPVIGEANKYYLFSLVGPTGATPNYNMGSLFYSIVDMSLEAGLGDVAQGMKNIPLTYDTLAEAMIAIPGENCDIWLLVHALNKPEIWAYRISATGVDTIPVKSNMGGSYLPSPYPGLASLMSLAVSPNRQKIARRGGILVPTIVADFDPNTGMVTNSIQLPGMYYGGSHLLCFSPDGSKLYVSDMPAYGLGQFDISVYDSTSIATSLVTVMNNPHLAYIRRYNDKIYIDQTDGLVDTSNTHFIHRINRPNLSGLSCDLEYDAISLSPGTDATLGFGNDVVFPFPGDTIFVQALDTIICPRTEITLTSPQTFDSTRWSDGSSNASLTVTQAGVYWKMQSDGCHYQIDTFVVEFVEFPEPVITINVLELGTVATYSTYQWMFEGNVIPNATQPTYSVPENGDYQVIVTNEQGCTDTSEVYEVTNVSIQDLADISALISVWPNPVQDDVFVRAPVPIKLSLSSISGKLIQEEMQSNSLSTRDLATGMYLLRITDMDGRLLKVEKLLKVKK